MYVSHFTVDLLGSRWLADKLRPGEKLTIFKTDSGMRATVESPARYDFGKPTYCERVIREFVGEEA